MGLTGMVLSAMSFVSGAIMYWAISAPAVTAVQSQGLRISTIGVILMIAGAIGFCASSIVFAVSRRAPAPRTHSTDRVIVDQTGATSELHEQRS